MTADSRVRSRTPARTVSALSASSTAWGQAQIMPMEQLDMTKQLMLSQGTSSFVYGAYTACAYFTPIVGGVIGGILGHHHDEACRAFERRQAIAHGMRY